MASAQLHFHVDPLRVEDRFRRRRVRARQRVGVPGFDELEERAGQPRLLERPEATVLFRVVIVLAAQLFVESLAIRRRDERALNGECARHGQSTVSGKVSRLRFTKLMNLSASAPSTTRWSNERERYEQVRIASMSSPSGPVSTLGRFSIAPTQRIATCGWLMIGVPVSEPKTPGLVMVKVPSCTSRGSRRLVRARVARSLSARVRPVSERLSAPLITGTIKPQSSATAMPRLICLR